jgi:hypothetical protein
MVHTDHDGVRALCRPHCLPNVRARRLPPLRSPQLHSPPSFRATRAGLSCEIRHLCLASFLLPPVCLFILLFFRLPVVERILNFTIITSFEPLANQAFLLRFVFGCGPREVSADRQEQVCRAGALHAGPGMLPSAVSANVSAFQGRKTRVNLGMYPSLNRKEIK